MEITIAVDLGRHAVKTAAERLQPDGYPVMTSTPSLAWVGPAGELRTGMQAQLAARRAPDGLVEGWLDRLFSMRVVAGDESEGTQLRPADLLAHLLREPLRVSVSGLARYAEDVRYAQVLLVVPHGWIEAQLQTAERVLTETLEDLCPEAEVEVVPVPAAHALRRRLPDTGGALVLDVGASGTTLHLLDADGAVSSDRVPGLGGHRLDERMLAELTERVGDGPTEAGDAPAADEVTSDEVTAGEVTADDVTGDEATAAERAGGESVRLRMAATGAREQLSTQPSVDIPVGTREEGQGAASALVHLTQDEAEDLLAADLERVVDAGQDFSSHAMPGLVLLVGGAAQTPSLLRIAEEGFAAPWRGPIGLPSPDAGAGTEPTSDTALDGDDAGGGHPRDTAPESATESGGAPTSESVTEHGRGPGATSAVLAGGQQGREAPEVRRDPEPTHAAVLGALALAAADDEAWWAATTPAAAGGATTARAAGAGSGRRVPVALAGALGILVVGGLGVAALQLTGDDEDSAGDLAPTTVATSTTAPGTTGSTTTSASDATRTTSEPTTSTGEESTSEDPTTTSADAPVAPAPVEPAPPAPAPVEPAPVEPPPAPPAPPPVEPPPVSPSPTQPEPTEPPPAPSPVPPPPPPEPTPTPTPTPTPPPEPDPTEPAPPPTGSPSNPGGPPNDPPERP